ncbi:tRNA (N(6)-L-threonylcarbamoyladenosine(37)-C(2))-methylthiotransferase [Candidatus Pacearchaeota archaeon]|nr:tRNA (N(6)-L-threonylcarbamoyladenosine(37)-C(2))-methylthiotransferase [Candidatus Pacearchaeota archaeon]
MKVFVKTYGCTFNQRDGQAIEGVLAKAGFILVENEESADIIVVNTCGVKEVTQNKIINYIKSLKKPTLVGGCLTKMVDFSKLNVHIFDTNTISQLPHQIKNNLKENISNVKENHLKLPVIETNDIQIIPIAEGCLGNCTYCSVKFARGNLKSYTIDEIVNSIHAKKILLTSQDNGCYGLDINTNLIELLNKILELKQDFKLRIGMMNPEHVIKMLPELIEIYKDPRVIKFIHIPVQSGSNKVLKEMNRKYTIEQFKKIVNGFRKAIPDICISTDIIVGYPTETEEDFLGTKKLLKELKLEIVNLSKFASRPKTLASQLKPISQEAIKERSKILTKIIKN